MYDSRFISNNGRLLNENLGLLYPHLDIEYFIKDCKSIY